MPGNVLKHKMLGGGPKWATCAAPFHTRYILCQGIIKSELAPPAAGIVTGLWRGRMGPDWYVRTSAPGGIESCYSTGVLSGRPRDQSSVIPELEGRSQREHEVVGVQSKSLTLEVSS